MPDGEFNQLSYRWYMKLSINFETWFLKLDLVLRWNKHKYSAEENQ